MRGKATALPAGGQAVQAWRLWPHDDTEELTVHVLEDNRRVTRAADFLTRVEDVPLVRLPRLRAKGFLAPDQEYGNRPCMVSTYVPGLTLMEILCRLERQSSPVASQQGALRQRVARLLPGRLAEAPPAQRNGLPASLVCAIGAALGQTMRRVEDAMQTQGSMPVHRDLKPENIVLSPDGSVPPIDWFSVGYEGPMPIITGQDERVGSLPYSAERQVAEPRDPPSRRWDMASLALTLLHLHSGEAPPQNLSKDDVRAQRNAWFRQLRPGMPHELWAFLTNVAADRTQFRSWQDMAEVLQALAGAYASDDVRHKMESSPGVMPMPSSWEDGDYDVHALVTMYRDSEKPDLTHVREQYGRLCSSPRMSRRTAIALIAGGIAAGASGLVAYREYSRDTFSHDQTTRKMQEALQLIAERPYREFNKDEYAALRTNEERREYLTSALLLLTHPRSPKKMGVFPAARGYHDVIALRDADDKAVRVMTRHAMQQHAGEPPVTVYTLVTFMDGQAPERRDFPLQGPRKRFKYPNGDSSVRRTNTDLLTLIVNDPKVHALLATQPIFRNVAEIEVLVQYYSELDGFPQKRKHWENVMGLSKDNPDRNDTLWLKDADAFANNSFEDIQ